MGGLVIMALGAGFSYFGQSYVIGSLSSMGPGFMPVVLGCVLAFLGMAILSNGIARRPAVDAENEVVHLPDLRGLVAIVVGMLAFLFLADTAGLIIASFAVVFLSALGDKGNRLRDALLLAAGITIFGVLVFYYGMRIRLPLLPVGLTQ